MKVNVDTNFLVCLATLDDPGEAQAAQAALQRVELIAVTLLSPCEFTRVLSDSKKIAPERKRTDRHQRQRR